MICLSFKTPLMDQHFSYMIDVSNVGCHCNSAAYFIDMPANQPGPGGDYYCDANHGNELWCPEYDTWEGNRHTVAGSFKKVTFRNNLTKFLFLFQELCIPVTEETEIGTLAIEEVAKPMPSTSTINSCVQTPVAPLILKSMATYLFLRNQTFVHIITWYFLGLSLYLTSKTVEFPTSGLSKKDVLLISTFAMMEVT